jgi:hypothetical protein
MAARQSTGRARSDGTDAPTTVPTARSMRQWSAGKELDGRMVVKLTLTDQVEARAWMVWLSDRAMENEQAEKSAL